jgi:RNA polymerase sigma-70 factor (ECF subfamily)
VEDARTMMNHATRAAQRLNLEIDFEDVVRLQQRRIYRIMYLLIRDRDEADSLTQECFLRAYARRADFRGEANPGTWLVRIAINLARDQQRSRRYAFWKRLMRGRDEETHRFADRQRNPEEEISASERAKAVWVVVGSLPAKQRTVFTLRFAEDMPLQEIADVMRVREGTVKSQLSSAIRAVRRGLGLPEGSVLKTSREESAE